MEMPEFMFTCEQDLSGVALIPYAVMFAVRKIQIIFTDGTSHWMRPNDLLVSHGRVYCA